MKTPTHNETSNEQLCPFVKGLRAWGPVVIWMGVIFYLSAQPKLPGPASPFWNILLKKLGHFTVYGVLAWLVLRALSRGRERPARQRWCAWGIAVLYAMSDEFHQGFVPGRHPKVMDLLIDACGAATALLIEEKARKILADILGERPRR
jgi:VanZ family protein